MCNIKISQEIVSKDKITFKDIMVNKTENDVTKIIELSKELYININSPNQEKDRLKKHMRGFVLKKKPYVANWN